MHARVFMGLLAELEVLDAKYFYCRAQISFGLGCGEMACGFWAYDFGIY